MRTPDENISRIPDNRADGDGDWHLWGLDTFSMEYYPLGTHGLDYTLPAYASERLAREHGQRYLAGLEITQPSASSGGQGGIQDRVYLVHPDGRAERLHQREDPEG